MMTEEQAREAVNAGDTLRDAVGNTGFAAEITTDGETVMVRLAAGSWSQWTDILDLTPFNAQRCIVKLGEPYEMQECGRPVEFLTPMRAAREGRYSGWYHIDRTMHGHHAVPGSWVGLPTSAAALDGVHAEARRENWARGQVAAAGKSWATHMVKFGGTVIER